MKINWIISHVDVDLQEIDRHAGELRCAYSRVRVVTRNLSALGTSIVVYVALYDPDSLKTSVETAL